MTTSNTDKPKLSYEELMEQLKDPALLQAAAAKHGLKLTPPEAEKKEEKKRELPSFEIPEDADMPTMIKALNSGFKTLFKHVDDRVSEAGATAKTEVMKSKQEEIAEKVRSFAKEHKDFEKLVPFIEPYFNTGKYTIEEAYKMGKRASGESVEEKKGAKTETKETPSRMTTTSESDDEQVEKVKPKSVRDSVKQNLEKLLKDKPLEEDVLDEDDEV